MRSRMKNHISILLMSLALGPFALAQNAGPTKISPKLTPPAKGQRLRVAFVLTEDAVMIDFAGPWEVFQDAMVPSRGVSMEDQHPFELYTVSDSTKPIHASDGMQILPDYSFDNAPRPDVVVIPAQSGRSPKMLDWVRRMTRQSDVVMSVCTGAFVLADAGLLNGKHATTHHDALARLQKKFPEITVERGMRYVQSDPVIFTAGGLSSGIDLALHIVDLYFGRQAAQATADMMEYEGTGWKGNGKAVAQFSSPQPPAYPSDAVADGPLGRWEGVIHTSDGGYHVVLHLWRGNDGSLGGALDSVDQEAYGLALGNISIHGSAFSFTVPSIMGSYEGTLDQSAIRGTWKQHGTVLKLDLERRGSGRAPGVSNDRNTGLALF